MAGNYISVSAYESSKMVSQAAVCLPLTQTKMGHPIVVPCAVFNYLVVPIKVPCSVFKHFVGLKVFCSSL